MPTFNVSLVNLPENLQREIASLIQSERLGSFQICTHPNLASFFNDDLSETNCIIAFDNAISEDEIQQLNITEKLPVILITSTFDFEMERTAHASNVNLLIYENNPELCSLVYGFIKQFKIYQHHHALIVDDSRVDCTVIANVIANEFIETETEFNANNVIERLEANKKISIVVLDYQMPDIDGCSLMRKIRLHFTDREFIFIGLTGHRNGALQFLHEGANNVFLKPVDGEIFVLTLRKLVFNLHQSQQQRTSLSNYKNIINKISHDIRNPIYVLMNINDLFLDKQIKNNSLELVAKLSDSAKENITRTFDELLSYIEMNSYKESPRLKACSLNSMIASQLFLESHQAKLKNIIMNQSFEQEAHAVCVPHQIELVITSLTNNAIKHSIKDSEIDIRLYKDKADIIFEVEDSSPLIPEKSYEDIFQNISAKPHHVSSEVDAHSLGLTFCKEIIESHGGVIGIRSGERGNIFYFRIPSEPEIPLTPLH